MDTKKWNKHVDDVEMAAWVLVVIGTTKATNRFVCQPFLKHGGLSGKLAGNVLALCYGLVVGSVSTSILEKYLGAPLKKANQRIVDAETVDFQEV